MGDAERLGASQSRMPACVDRAEDILSSIRSENSELRFVISDDSLIKNVYSKPEIADVMAFMLGTDQESQFRLIDEVFLDGLETGSKVLLPGSGWGVMSKHLRAKYGQKNLQLIDIDISFEQLLKGKQPSTRVKGAPDVDDADVLGRVEADVSRLPYEDSVFDCVLASGLLRYLDERSLNESYHDCLRVLKNGGHFVVKDSNPQSTSRLEEMAKAQGKEVRRFSRDVEQFRVMSFFFYYYLYHKISPVYELASKRGWDDSKFGEFNAYIRQRAEELPEQEGLDRTLLALAEVAGKAVKREDVLVITK